MDDAGGTGIYIAIMIIACFLDIWQRSLVCIYNYNPRSHGKPMRDNKKKKTRALRSYFFLQASVCFRAYTCISEQLVERFATNRWKRDTEATLYCCVFFIKTVYPKKSYIRCVITIMTLEKKEELVYFLVTTFPKQSF